MERKGKKQTKSSTVQPNRIPLAMLAEDKSRFNGILKTDGHRVWTPGELAPIEAISLSKSIVEINAKAIKFLGTGSYKLTVEAQIEVSEITTIKYIGSACKNREYQETFLTKQLDPGLIPITWTTIIEATRGEETALVCDRLCSFNGQIIIVKI